MVNQPQKPLVSELMTRSTEPSNGIVVTTVGVVDFAPGDPEGEVGWYLETIAVRVDLDGFDRSVRLALTERGWGVDLEHGTLEYYSTPRGGVPLLLTFGWRVPAGEMSGIHSVFRKPNLAASPSVSETVHLSRSQVAEVGYARRALMRALGVAIPTVPLLAAKSVASPRAPAVVVRPGAVPRVATPLLPILLSPTEAQTLVHAGTAPTPAGFGATSPGAVVVTTGLTPADVRVSRESEESGGCPNCTG